MKIKKIGNITIYYREEKHLKILDLLENNDLDCRPCGLHGGDKCPKGHFKCMLDIKPEMVMEKITSYFN